MAKTEPVGENIATDNRTDPDDDTEKTDTEPEIKSDVEIPEKTERQLELEKYWKTVRDNPTDFTGWTYLLQFVEQENIPEEARGAYEAFFQHYPYCYGYWKKYADLERRHGNLDLSIEVFEKGLRAIPLSVELWIHYLNFFQEEFGSTEKGIVKTRNLHERAIAAAGTDFRSDKLWDTYIAWEVNPVKVTAIYDRLLTIPTQLYSHHFENFKKHVTNHHPKEILSLDDFFKMRREVVAKAPTPDGEEEVPEDGPPPVIGPAPEELPPGMEREGTSDRDEVQMLRHKMIQARESVHKSTESEVSKRWAFEEGIKRPYFHVKPLERTQLKNWREYLDYEIQQGLHERVVVLFERCMIACCLYEDFWMKYAKYMEEHSHEAVRNVYRRACNIHLPKKPYIHMAWAAFEERQGNHDAAWEVLSNLEKSVPGLVMVSMRRISLERRKGNMEDCEQLFKYYIENAGTTEVMTFFCIKYARYLFKIKGDTEGARAVLHAAIAKDKSNEKLYLQLLDLEYQCRPINEDRVNELFGLMMINPDFSNDLKVKMSRRQLEFLEDFGSNIHKIKECYDEHQKLLKEVHNEKKRKHHDGSSNEPSEKRSKMDLASNGSGDGATSAAAAQTASNEPHAVYNYGHWPGYSSTSSYYPHHWGYSSQYYP
ncbi:hypothetical protein ScPMuIL_014676 [Solemya velum]